MLEFGLTLLVSGLAIYEALHNLAHCYLSDLLRPSLRSLYPSHTGFFSDLGICQACSCFRDFVLAVSSV